MKEASVDMIKPAPMNGKMVCTGRMINLYLIRRKPKDMRLGL